MTVDPRVSAVLEELETVSRAHRASAAPSAEFRADLRAQLVAITPRIVAESAAENAPAVGARGDATTVAPGGVPVLRPRPSPRPDADAPSSRGGLLAALRRMPLGRVSMGRPLMIAASLVTVLALASGGAVFMSRDSVPGDTLYGLKRTGEDVRLSFAGNDRDRAKDQLEFATTRVEEARTLAGRVSATGSGPQADGRLSAQNAALIASALTSADTDTRDATRLLGTEAVDSASPDPLAGLRSWVPQQSQRLADLRAAASSDARVAAATSQSLLLLTTAGNRATALAQRVDCNCLRNAPSDAFGPLPVSGAVRTPPSVGTPAPGSSVGGGKTTTPGGSRSTPPGGTSSPQPGQTQSPAPSQSPSRPLLPTQLPSLKLPKLPLPTGTQTPALCKVNVLGIRVCPSTSS